MAESMMLKGALAGFLATAPMTLAMDAMHRQLPAHERYPLPPSDITAELTEEAGVRQHLDPPEHIALTMLAHFGYGAAAGALYGPISRHTGLSPVASGVVFGLGVWTVSYLGLLPALGILRSATEHPARRNELMIASHVVWGAATGLLTSSLSEQE